MSREEHEKDEYKNLRIVIVGGGILGGCLAWNLSKRAKVTLLDVTDAHCSEMLLSPPVSREASKRNDNEKPRSTNRANEGDRNGNDDDDDDAADSADGGEDEEEDERESLKRSLSAAGPSANSSLTTPSPILHPIRRSGSQISRARVASRKSAVTAQRLCAMRDGSFGWVNSLCIDPHRALYGHNLLSRTSMRLWPGWLRRLGLSEQAVSYRPEGSCLWAVSERASSAVREMVERSARIGYKSFPIPPTELKAKIGSRVHLSNAAMCVYNPDEATVDADLVTSACLAQAEDSGTRILRNVRPLKLQISYKRPYSEDGEDGPPVGVCTGLHTSIGLLEADRVILASGIGQECAELARLAGLNFPVVPCTDVIIRTAPVDALLLRSCACLQKFLSEEERACENFSWRPAASKDRGTATILAYHLRQEQDGCVVMARIGRPPGIRESLARETGRDKRDSSSAGEGETSSKNRQQSDTSDSASTTPPSIGEEREKSFHQFRTYQGGVGRNGSDVPCQKLFGGSNPLPPLLSLPSSHSVDAGENHHFHHPVCGTSTNSARPTTYPPPPDSNSTTPISTDFVRRTTQVGTYTRPSAVVPHFPSKPQPPPTRGQGCFAVDPPPLKRELPMFVSDGGRFSSPPLFCEEPQSACPSLYHRSEADAPPSLPLFPMAPPSSSLPSRPAPPTGHHGVGSLEIRSQRPLSFHFNPVFPNEFTDEEVRDASERLFKAWCEDIPCLSNVPRTAYGWSRTMPADGLHAVGFMPQVTNVYVAITHGAVTLAPVIGKLCTKEILTLREENEMLHPYRLTRFQAKRRDDGAHDDKT